MKGREQLLLDTDLSAKELESSDCLISYEQQRQVIQNALRISCNPGIGLQIGAMAPLSTHGALAYAALSSPNLQTALEMFVRYSQTRVGFLRLTATLEQGKLQIALIEKTDLGPIRQFTHEVVVLTFKSLLDTTIGPNTSGLEVRFGYPAPRHARNYAPALAMQVSFGAPTTVISLPENLLKRHCATADSKLFRIAERQCREELAAQQDALPFAARVQNLVSACLEDGSTQESVANHLGVSVRTLVRRLTLENSTFRQILDTARQQAAQRYLLDTDFPIAEIAQRLGYLDPSNFGRAVRGWFGMSPSAFRSMDGEMR